MMVVMAEIMASTSRVRAVYQAQSEVLSVFCLGSYHDPLRQALLPILHMGTQKPER